MSEKHIKLIKPTHDGKYWAMGSVVNTIEEAFDRCDKKGRSKNYFFSLPPDYGENSKWTFEICGPREYIMLWVGDVKRIMLNG